MIQIAIDGPSGAGKSTLARAVAKQLGYVYVDTGAMYRAVGVYVRNMGLDPADAEAVCFVLPNVNIALSYGADGEQQVFLNGENVTKTIRENEISGYASKVSAIPAVRAYLLDLQRDIAKTNNVIMDGRDIGTVILPDAQVKIFMSATPEVRAQRRCAELMAKGQTVALETVLAEMQARDEADASRAAAPLRAAPDAILFDNSANSFEKNTELLIGIIREKIGEEQ